MGGRTLHVLYRCEGKPGSAEHGRRLGQVLDIVQPDVLHIHNLLNLSFDLPALAARMVALVYNWSGVSVTPSPTPSRYR